VCVEDAVHGAHCGAGRARRPRRRGDEGAGQVLGAWSALRSAGRRHRLRRRLRLHCPHPVYLRPRWHSSPDTQPRGSPCAESGPRHHDDPPGPAPLRPSRTSAVLDTPAHCHTSRHALEK
jgi:hypothetical protein